MYIVPKENLDCEDLMNAYEDKRKAVQTKAAGEKRKSDVLDGKKKKSDDDRGLESVELAERRGEAIKLMQVTSLPLS